VGKYDIDALPAEDTTTAATSSRGKYERLLHEVEPVVAEGPPAPPRTWWDTAKGVAQTADDAVRAAANAVTFGMADRLAGAMPGTSTAEQVRLSEEARKRSPYASIGGDVAGAVALPGIGGRQLAARYGGGLLARGAGYGAEGAVLGAAQGAGNTYTGNLEDYVANAKTGGLMGGILGAGIGAAFGPRGGYRSTAKVPETAELYAEKTANYRDLANSPALYEPSALARAATPTEDVLRAQRFHPNDSPRSFQAINEMRAPPTTEHLGLGAPVSPGDIEFIRKGLNQINPVTGQTDLASAKYVKRALDNFVLNPPPGAVLPGTEAAAREATALAERARANYGGYKRAQAWDDLIANAETTTGATHSGLNLQNELRKGVRSMVRQKEGLSPASKAGYTPAEIAALTNFAQGSAGTNMLRGASNILGGGGGLATMLSAGLGLGGGTAAGQYFKDDPVWGGVAGLALPATGLALRKIGNARAARETADLGSMIRQRTPLYQERAANAPMVPPGGSGAARARDALTLELLRLQGIPRITVTPREED
jgi:hypothetical protein